LLQFVITATAGIQHPESSKGRKLCAFVPLALCNSFFAALWQKKTKKYLENHLIFINI
jgi:hypothetical protein